jgi:hypothetical protein
MRGGGVSSSPERETATQELLDAGRGRREPMIRVEICSEFSVRAIDGARLAPEDLHAQGERLMEALLDLERINPDVTDSTTASEADRGVVLVETLVTAETEAEALSKAHVFARTAIHTIGGSTPGWDDNPSTPTAEYQPRRTQLERV